jgi:hypothetical protein
LSHFKKEVFLYAFKRARHSGERVIVIDQTVAAVAVCHEMSWTTEEADYFCGLVALDERSPKMLKSSP